MARIATFILVLTVLAPSHSGLSQFPSPPLGELVVPAAASAHGLANTLFRTDLWVVNLSDSQSISLHLGYLCRTGCDSLPSPPSVPTHSFSLAPGTARLFEDVIATVFSAHESSGALDIYEPGFGAVVRTPFFATSRTYTVDASGQGSFGTAIPAQSWSQATLRSKFVGLASNGGDLSSGFRSNAGVFVYSGRGNVTYRLTDSAGRPLGTPLSVPAALTQQVNDVFQALGAGTAVVRDALLEITTDYPALPYVTAIDNRTGDSVFLPGAIVPQPTQ